MESERRRQLLLGALGVALAVAAYVEWPRTAAAPAPTSNSRAGAARPAAAPGTLTAPDVRLEALDEGRPKPGAVDRNLFKFRQRMAPLPRSADVVVAPVVPAGPPPPPPLPPIALKFIGVLESDASHRIAVLSDGRGAPIYGKEGESVLGQYKILRIGAESVDMAYLDGRGRQTIRLSGS